MFTVESLLETRMNGSTREFLVKWAGYTMAQSTWEPSTNLKPYITKFYSDSSKLGTAMPAPTIKLSCDAGSGAKFNFLGFGADRGNEEDSLGHDIFSLGETSIPESHCK